MAGFVLDSYEIVKERIQQTTTRTGRTVVVRIQLKQYPTGLTIDRNVQHHSRII